MIEWIMTLPDTAFYIMMIVVTLVLALLTAR